MSWEDRRILAFGPSSHLGSAVRVLPLFWDEGYGSNYPDLEYSPAIALLSRVISKPGVDRICIDLGYKAVAAEMPLERRVVFPSLPDAELLGQSEEHLVLKTSIANRMQLGQEIIAFPRHVCPGTVAAFHSSVQVVAGGRVLDERWEVDARLASKSPHGLTRIAKLYTRRTTLVAATGFH